MVRQEFDEDGMRQLAVENDDAFDALLDGIDAGFNFRNHPSGDRAVGDEIVDFVEHRPSLLVSYGRRKLLPSSLNT